MSNLTALLTTLNTRRRVALGKAPLKSWKESQAKLEAAINAITWTDEHQATLSAEIDAQRKADEAVFEPEVKVMPTKAAKGVKAPKRNTRVKVQPITTGLADTGKKAKVKAAKKVKASKARVAAEGTFTLSDLARELNVNPKIMRAKARRHADDLKAHRTGDSWSFTTASKAAVTAILK